MPKYLIKYVIIKESLKLSLKNARYYLRGNLKIILLWPIGLFIGILYILFTTKKYRQRHGSILFDDVDENELQIILDIYWQLSKKHIVDVTDYRTNSIGLYVNHAAFLNLCNGNIVIAALNNVEQATKTVSLSNPNYINEILKVINCEKL